MDWFYLTVEWLLRMQGVAVVVALHIVRASTLSCLLRAALMKLLPDAQIPYLAMNVILPLMVAQEVPLMLLQHDSGLRQL
jgi:hypothetical protein